MSDDSRIPQRRIAPIIMIQPDVPSMVSDALQVISTEILQFKAKVNKGTHLTTNEARVLQGYIKSLVEISRETRERDDSNDLANVSDEELLKLIEKVKKKTDGAP